MDLEARSQTSDLVFFGRVEVTIRNLVPDYLDFERQARGYDGDLRVLWEHSYASPHRDVLDAYFELGEPDDFEATIEQLAMQSDRFADRAELLTKAARQLAPGVAALLDADPERLPYITMVGLNRADGWVQNLNEVPTAFFAVERFREPPWEQVHVAHETTHLVQAGLRDEAWDDEVIGLRLLLEGIAIASTQRLLDQVPAWAHFNHDPQTSGELVERWHAALPELARALRDLIDCQDAQQTARFFYPDWLRTDRDVPERCGYFVGWRVVEQLAVTISLAELARLDPPKALDLAASALDRLAVS